jgi:hypothetical protein
MSPRACSRSHSKNSDPGVSYVAVSALSSIEPFDCVYMNGVLHHIQADKRLATVTSVFNALRPGGLFALWENNPWNPGTRYIMSRIAFDRDAVMLNIPESHTLCRDAGLVPLSTDTLFFFPRSLSALRPFERILSATKLGGQYMVLCQRPS